MFARGLGGGETPNDTYLSMATKMLDAVATEVRSKPWVDPTEPDGLSLDVERWRRAWRLHRQDINHVYNDGGIVCSPLPPDDCTADIATEYARLTPTPAPPEARE